MIFVDTSAFVALNNPKDPHHKKSLQVSLNLEKESAPFFTTNYILAESYTVISQKVDKEASVYFRENLDLRIRIVRVGESLEETAWEIFKETRSKNVSYVDCTSFAAMKAFNIKRAFAFDDDFKRAGFSLLT
ncbi:MAG: PIN domain-containing protein [Candidatus Woykebacteria bacterium]